MTFFRRKYLQKYITLITGLIFLNISFFSVELSCLELNRENRKLVENLVRIIAGTNDEEKDTSASTSETHSLVKEVDLFVNHSASNMEVAFSIVTNNYHHFHADEPLAGNRETPLQPPEA